jgi:hypothetical protein
MILAAASALLLYMTPVDHHSLGSCYGPCLHPAFPLHGYRYEPQERRTRLPYFASGKKGAMVHVSFVPPFTGACEVFEVVRSELGASAQKLAERPVQPHVIHLELKLPTDADLVASGRTPFGRTIIGMDCWKFGHDQDVTYSRFYEIPAVGEAAAR